MAEIILQQQSIRITSDNSESLFFIPADKFATTIDTNQSTSYSYCAWICIHKREENQFVSLLHHGEGEFIRCPGIWLHNLSNQLHVRVDSNKQTNQGIDWSKSELPMNEAVHIAVIVDQTTKSLSLYLNGVLDVSYDILKDDDEVFLVGSNQGCYLGKDLWHGGSDVTFEDVVMFPYAITDELFLKGIMMRSRSSDSPLPVPLPRLDVPNPSKRLGVSRKNHRK